MKKIISNETRVFAKAIKEMFKMHEESYKTPKGEKFGKYILDMETCAYRAAKNNGLGDGLWYILVLASTWGNDLQYFAENPEEYIKLESVRDIVIPK
jgi:hypothetical protein